jgi:hypothetical protein
LRFNTTLKVLQSSLLLLLFFRLKFVCIYHATVTNVIEQFNKWFSSYIDIPQTQLSRFNLRTETESSLRNVVF